MDENRASRFAVNSKKDSRGHKPRDDPREVLNSIL